MKKILCILAALMLLAAAVPAGAENSLQAVYDAAAELLFETENVTLEGEARLSLDGEWFKTVQALYIQDGENSLWQLHLTSPRADGSERENGYTVVANGEKLFVMEVYQPGMYRPGLDGAQRTILRRSVQLDLLNELIREAVADPETLLGKDAVTRDEAGKETRILLQNGLPEKTDNLLNLLAQFAARRYFRVDYDRMSEPTMGTMASYLTVTQGILGTTKAVSLKEADLLVRQDDKGQLAEVNGSASFVLKTANDGDRLLEIRFSGEAGARGTSHVDEFNPADYGVDLPDYGPGEDGAEVPAPDAETAQQALGAAAAELDRAGLLDSGLEADHVMMVEENIRVVFMDEKAGVRVSCLMDPEGRLLELYNEINAWQAEDIEYRFDGKPEEKMTEAAAEKAMQYLQEVYPGIGEKVGKLQVQWWYESDGETYICFMEDPIAQDWEGVMVIVRAEPEWRVEYYSCISNG